MQIAPGSVVRPVVTIAGLDSRKLYFVANIERTAMGYTLAFLTGPTGALLPVENAHLVLEVVSTSTIRPRAALAN